MELIEVGEPWNLAIRQRSQLSSLELTKTMSLEYRHRMGVVTGQLFPSTVLSHLITRPQDLSKFGI